MINGIKITEGWEFEVNAREFGLTNYNKILVESTEVHDIKLTYTTDKKNFKRYYLALLSFLFALICSWYFHNIFYLP